LTGSITRAELDHPSREEPRDDRNGYSAGGHTEGVPEIKHGAAATYEAGKCRCPECREAAMAARRLQRERRRQRVAAGDASRIVHGTWAAYLTDKCRCGECRAMKSAYMKQYRSKKKDLTEGAAGQATL
jgi:hypothetical protein